MHGFCSVVLTIYASSDVLHFDRVLATWGVDSCFAWFSCRAMNNCHILRNSHFSDKTKPTRNNSLRMSEGTPACFLHHPSPWHALLLLLHPLDCRLSAWTAENHGLGPTASYKNPRKSCTICFYQFWHSKAFTGFQHGQSDRNTISNQSGCRPIPFNFTKHLKTFICVISGIFDSGTRPSNSRIS